MNDPPAAHELFTPTLLDLLNAVRDAAARVVATAGRRGAPPAADAGEAVHDFRVALRRLRTLLRPARHVYGRRRVRAASEDLRRFAGATSVLRDEEVLRETLAGLDLPPRARRDLDRWAGQRARQERARRAAVVKLLRQVAPPALLPAHPPPLEHALLAIEALTRRRPHTVDATELGLRALNEARASVAELSGTDLRDVAAMHALRIRFKRLRYTAELFAPLLGDEVRRIAKGAAKMQRRLGDLHDLDQALVRVRRARGLPPRSRTAVLRALRSARTASAEVAGRELAEALTPPPSSS
jgi:CHAD domain-containing protein